MRPCLEGDVLLFRSNPDVDQNPDFNQNPDVDQNLDNNQNPYGNHNPDVNQNPDVDRNPDVNHNPDVDQNQKHAATFRRFNLSSDTELSSVSYIKKEDLPGIAYNIAQLLGYRIEKCN